MVDLIVFVVSAAIILGGGLGVVLFRNPVHNALSLIASFFGVAILFILQNAQFLAFVQVVVYAGAIVVLFLFVIMLLGVDRDEVIDDDALPGQKAAGLAAGAAMFVLLCAGLFLSGPGGDDGAVALTGGRSEVAPKVEPDPTDTEADSVTVQLARDLFTRNLLAFEATGLLLTIATIGAVVLVRNRGAEDLVVDEPGTATR
ncbi:MAG: NADH-quinone oxidoreductase subunit J [Acidimicrobiales bacterium]